MPAVTPDLITHVDNWLDTYSTLSPADRCDFINQTLDYPLTEDFLEDTEMSILIAELEDTAGPTAVVPLVEKLRRACPAFHLQELGYVEDIMLAWGLFHDDPDQIATAAGYFRKDPVKFVTNFLMTFRWLCLYQKRDIAIEQAKTGYPLIHASPDIIHGVESDLSEFLILDQCEGLYDQISCGESPNAASLAELEHELYGDEAVDFGSQVIPLLSDPNWPQPTSDWRNKERRPAVLNDLFWFFLRDQREAKNLPFTTSSYIWDGLFRLLEGRQDIQPDTYFYPTEEELLQYLSAYSGFLSSEQDKAFATLWGIPYVADFLKNHGWMTTEEHAHLISLTEHSKSMLIEGYQSDLWRYDFVHRWTPPDSADPDMWAKEKQIFADSLTAIRNIDQDHVADPFDSLSAGAIPSLGSLFGENHSWPERSAHTSGSKHSGRTEHKKPKNRKKNKKRRRH